MVPFQLGVIDCLVSVTRIHVIPGVAPTVENAVDVNVPSAGAAHVHCDYAKDPHTSSGVGVSVLPGW
jgi:hypothetical protein